MKKRLSVLIAVSLTAASILFVQQVQACPDGQYERCVFNACVCLPEIGGTPGQVFEKGKKEIEGAVGGPPLAGWITASRNTAINGALPIPPYIRQALTGYASEDSMNRARFKIGDNGFLNLAHMLEQEGFAAAVTLIDVIVFRGPSEANDPSVWAHELTHVDQYQEWGVDSFAAQYAKDYQSVEAPAYAKGNGYWACAQQRGAMPVGGPPLPPVLPAPALAMGSFCYTPIGGFGPGPMQPVGTPCFVPTFQGPVGGRVGQ